MPFDSKSIANYFLTLAEVDNKVVTPMKIQKLVYIAHGWSLALKNEPLINVAVEAWDYGPVISILFHEFKRFGSEPIKEPALDFDEKNNQLVKTPIPEDQIVRDLLKSVWNGYGDFDGIQLANLTHRSGTPWAETKKKSVIRNVTIENEKIKAHFKDLYVRRTAQQ